MDYRQAGMALDNEKTARENLPFLALPMKSDSDRNVVQRKRARCGVRWSKCNFRSKFVAFGSIRLARAIRKRTRQFDIDGGLSFEQSYRYVQHSLSSFAATSRN